MRVLLSTWPAHGHVLPMMPLAQAAQRAGHDVVVASGIEGAVEAERRGVAAWDVGPSRAEADAAFRAAVPDMGAVPPERRMATVIGGMFGRASFERARRLVPMAEAWRPDLVVHSVTETAGAIAAARTGARHVVHGLGPLPAGAWDWFGAHLPELAAAWDVPGLVEEILDVTYLELCPPSLQRDAVAAFTHRTLMRPSPGDDGPLPWTAHRIESLPFERTVHLTLGTLFHGATHVFRTVLEGLRPVPANVIVTVGPGADPASLGAQPAHVLIADFAPHASLLPRCDALVTQGGAGTILAALVHGLPHLILPQGADQFVNADTAERAGVALQLRPDQLTPDAVTAHVTELLDDDGALRRAAERVRAEVEQMPTADDVLADLSRSVTSRSRS
jgi:UDP:flavonoid glycosyltransferase YjiC (YdhE family)